MPKFSHAIFKLITIILLALSAGVVAFSQTDNITGAIADLSSGNRDVRYNATIVLAKAKDDQRSIEPLITTLDDPDDEIREVAANTLGFRKDRRAVYALIRLLSDKNESVRNRAAEALGKIGDTAAVEPLIKSLNRSDHSCNYPVVQALGQMHDERAVMPLFSQIGTGCGSTIAESMGAEAVEQISEIVKRGSTTDRDTAVWLLEYFADERALDVLISVIGENNNSRVGTMAATTIARRIGVVAIEPLRTAFKKGDVETKKSVVRALAQIDDARINDVLIDLVTDKETKVRREVVETLAEMNKPGFGPQSVMIISDYGPKDDYGILAILAATDDKDPDIRNLAIRSLSKVQRDDVFRALITALDDPVTSAEASLALGERKDLRALPNLMKALKGEDPSMAARASQALTTIGEPAIDGLIAVLADKNKEYPLREIKRQKDRAKYPFAFWCGNEPPDPVLDPRVLAAYALGQIGAERAREPLTAATKDKASWLHDAAVAALERLDRKK